MNKFLTLAFVLAGFSAHALTTSADLCTTDKKPVHFEITDKALTMKIDEKISSLKFVKSQNASKQDLAEASKLLGADVVEGMTGALDAPTDGDQTSSFQYLKTKDGQVVVILAGMLQFSSNSCK